MLPQVLLTTPNPFALETSRVIMHSASDIHAILSSCAHSPLTASSTSDLHSSHVNSCEQSINSLPPAPRFMPQTPSGRVALPEVSGATARPPMMPAHLVDLESHLAVGDDTPVTDSNPTLREELQSYATDKSFSNPPETVTLEQDQERRGTQSLLTSVSSRIGQAWAPELASAGKVKVRSSLKGSPAWYAQRKLVDHASLDGSSSIPHSPSIHRESVKSDSKRTSWIAAVLLGLGLPITTPSSGTNTPPKRVSFAKEPMRYSEERERTPVADDDDDDGNEETKVDKSLTTKSRSIRRTKPWNGSVKGVGLRRVSPKRPSEVEKKGWLEWFLTIITASGGTGSRHMGVQKSSLEFGGRKCFESRRDDW